MKDIVSNCPLCEEHSLHVMGKEEAQVMQCINCGYVSSTKFLGTKETNEEYKKLTKEMKNWSKVENGRIWLPTIMTLPLGMLYPFDVDNMVNHQKEMKWAFSPMVDISEEEKENYPDGQGGFFKKRFDTDNPIIYDTFLEGISLLSKKMKEQNDSDNVGVRLPKLKKIDTNE